MEQPSENRDSWSAQRVQWVNQVNQLVDRIAQWARERQWSTQHNPKTISEDHIGVYTVPLLKIEVGDAGTILVEPIAMRVLGAQGRVDLEGYPTLNRIKLLLRDDDWQLVTDSNVRLRQPMEAATFYQVVDDLLA